MLLAFSVLSCGCALRADLVLQQLHKRTTATQLLGLAQGIDGHLYGIATGSVASDLGAIFKLAPGGDYIPVFAFNGGVAGSHPGGALVLADDGKLYGTAASGGIHGNGTVFRIPILGGLTPVLSFDGTNGVAPVGLSRGMDGYLYGCTFAGGAHGKGTVFRLATNGVLTTVFSFSQQHELQIGRPNAAPTQDADGFLYGTTSKSSLGEGSIYKLSTGGDFRTLVLITNSYVRLTGGLVQGPEGYLFGTTAVMIGRVATAGTVFRMTTNGDLTTLVSFNSTNGANPEAGLLFASDENLYGTTASGGISNRGTIFRMTPNGDFTTLVHFTGTNGSAPEAALIEASDHNLYGTTTTSGLSPTGGGTVFRLVEEPVILGNRSANGSVVLTWSSFAGGNYRLEYKSSLADGGWTPRISSVTATNSLTSFVDPIGPWLQRWYRVVLLQ